MKLMTFNILTNGEGEAGYRQQEIQQVIAKHHPDILCMQEGGDGDFWTAMIKEQGFVFSNNLEGSYRPSIYSRFPVLDHKALDFFSPGGHYIRIPFRDSELIILNVHLPWKPTEDPERVAVLEELISTYGGNSDRYVCICGDFNSRTSGEYGEAWQVEYMSRFIGLNEPISNGEWVAATSFVKTKGFTDSYRHLHSARGYSVHNTIETMRDKCPEFEKHFSDEVLQGRFLPAGVRIDYIFVNDKLLSCLKSCEMDDSPATFNSSDHSPFIAEFDEG